MKHEKLKRIPHIISGIVILLHGFERWEEEHASYPLFLISGIIFLSIALLHHRLSTLFPFVDTVFYTIEGLLAFVIAYEYHEAGKRFLPFVYICAGLFQTFAIFFFAYKIKLKRKKMGNFKTDKVKRRRMVIAVMLMLSIGNFTRLKGTENIRTIEFFSIFTIGALSGLLIYSIVGERKNKQGPENKA